MLTKTIFSTIIFAAILSLNCNKINTLNYDANLISNDNDEQILALTKTEKLKEKAKQRFNEFLNGHDHNPDFESSDMYDFKNCHLMSADEATGINLIIVENRMKTKAKQKALFGFIKDGDVLPGFVLNEIYKIGTDHYYVRLKSIKGKLIFSYSVIGQKVVVDPSNTGLSKDNPSDNQIESVFSECVSGWMNYLSSTENGGAILGITCLAFGAQCAAFLTGHCLARQVESWF